MSTPSDVPAAAPADVDPGSQPRTERPSHRRLSELFGYKVVEFGGGRCVAEWKPGPPFVNSSGGVWGGAVSAVADTICAMAVAAAIDPPPRFLPTVSMHVDFLRPLTPGATYLMKGHALRVGGRLAVADTNIVDAEDRVCARATCTFSVRR